MSENWQSFCYSWLESYSLSQLCRIPSLEDDRQPGKGGGAGWAMDVMLCFPGSDREGVKNDQFLLWLRWFADGSQLREWETKRAKTIDQRFYDELRRKGLYGESPGVLTVR